MYLQVWKKNSAPPISWKFEPRPPEDGEAPPHGSHGFIHGMSHQPITAVKNSCSWCGEAEKILRWGP